MKMGPYLVIEGNIGAGKTSLAEMLANDLNALLVLEEFAENSFLELFYKEPLKYAFPLELSFLAARYRQLNGLDKIEGMVIADYHFQKSLLFATINLAPEEIELYKSFFNIISPLIPAPDLVVFLDNGAESSMKNIAARNRHFESEIDENYISVLNHNYREKIDFFTKKALLKIDTSSLDFVNKKADYEYIKDLILSKLSPHGC